MNTRQLKQILVSSVTLLTIGVLLARADVRYVQEMSVEGMNDGKPFSTTTTYKRPGAERMETSFMVGNVKQQSVTLTRCATQDVLTLDPTLKIYYSSPLVPVPMTSTDAQPSPKPSKATGTMTMTLVSLRDLGMQTVGNAKTHAYEITTRMQTNGCLGNSDTTNKQQIWFGHEAADGGDGDGCPAMASGPSGGGGGCRTVTIRKGDWAIYDKITRGVPVRTRMMDGNGKVQMETTTSNVSRAKLAPSLFEVPAGYKRVSEAEFQKAQQEAMVKRLQADAMKVAGGEAGTEDN